MMPRRPSRIITLYALVVVFMAMSVVSHAQISTPPLRLSFQGFLLDQNGMLYKDGTWNVTAELWDAETGGNRVYTTTMPVVLVKGVFNMIVGEIDPLEGVDFTRQLWLEIKAPDALPFSKRAMLTAAPWAFVAQSSAVAGGLTPDATGAVLSLNDLQGNVRIRGGAGVRVTEENNDVIIDASRLLDMIELASLDTAVIKITKRKVVINGEEKTIVEVGLKDTSITKKYLSRSDASNQPRIVSVTADSITIPQYNIDQDGRIISVTTVSIPRRPDGMQPNRVAVTSPTGRLVESAPLGDRQVVMGRTGGAPAVTTITAGQGVRVEQNANDQLVISSDVASQLPFVSGRFTNNTGGYIYETPEIDVTTATPVAATELKQTARIIVTMESENTSTAFTVTNRTLKGFKVKFAGGLPDKASISWMVLNL